MYQESSDVPQKMRHTGYMTAPATGCRMLDIDVYLFICFYFYILFADAYNTCSAQHTRDSRTHGVLLRMRCCRKQDGGCTGADPGIYFGGGPNQDPQLKVKGEARIEGAKRPNIEGEARVEGAKRPRIEGGARTEGEAREKAGRGLGRGLGEPPPQKIFEKSNLKPFILVHRAI